MKAPHELLESLFHAAAMGDVNTLDVLLKTPDLDLFIQNDEGKNVLHVSAEAGHVDCVKAILQCLSSSPERKARIMDCLDVMGSTPLIYAIENKHTAVVTELLNQGANPNQENLDGLTPLHLAIATETEGHPMLKALLTMEGIDPDKKAGNLLHSAISESSEDRDIKDIAEGTTPLFFAVKLMDEKAVRMLLAYGADSNEESSNGYTPIYMAVATEDINFLELLLESGANPLKVAPDDWNTPLHVAVNFSGNLQIVRRLLDLGANPDQTNKEETTPLQIAAQVRGNEEVISVLLGKVRDPNKADMDGNTPLYLLAEMGDVEGVRTLLKKGAFPNKTNHKALTPLHIAAKNGHSEVVDLLLHSDVKPNQTTKEGFTPLHFAAKRKNNTSTIEKFGLPSARSPALKTLDLNPRDYQGRTPLSIASIDGHNDNAACLMKALHADPNIADFNGKTPLHHAVLKGNVELVKFLLVHHADPNQSDNEGCTPFHYAVQSKVSGIAEPFVDCNANMNAQNNHGMTPSTLLGRQLPARLIPSLRHGHEKPTQPTHAGDVPPSTFFSPPELLRRRNPKPPETPKPKSRRP